MVAEMLLAHRGLAALAAEDQQAAQIGRGQMERMRGVVAPVGGMGAAMRTGDLGAVRITEIPELEQVLERFGAITVVKSAASTA